MSNLLLAKAYALVMKAGPKSVYVAYADQANDDGLCWPSHNTTAMRTGLSPRAVQTASRWLQEHGALQCQKWNRGNGSQTANRYLLTPEEFDGERWDFKSRTKGPNNAALVDPTGGRICPPGGKQLLPPGAESAPPEPSLESSGETTPPLPPAGETSLSNSSKSRPAFSNGGSSNRARDVRLPLLSFVAWLAQCRTDGVKPIAEGDAVFAYCETAGIGEDILGLHWWLFKRRCSETEKRHREWRVSFRNSVESNTYRLWYIKPGQAAQLSTQGLQAQAARAAEQRMAQAGVAEMVFAAANEPAQHRMEHAA